MTSVYYSRSATQSMAALFPMVVALGVLPFLGNPSSLIPQHLDLTTIGLLSLIALVLVLVAWKPWRGLQELLFFGRSPAIVFDVDAMAIRKLGSRATIAISYSNISQFFLEETEHKGNVRTCMIIIGESGKRLCIDCDALSVPAKELQRMLMKNTPDISYQSGR